MHKRIHEHVPFIQMYNLMKESYGKKWNVSEKFKKFFKCTIEYANTNKLQQDHPCVLQLIRKNYVRETAPVDLTYHRNYLADPANTSNGNNYNLRFCGINVNNGEYFSNTFFMERSLECSGLNVEADKKAHGQLLTSNIKAHTASFCLSTKPYPLQVLSNTTESSQLSSYIVKLNHFKSDFKIEKEYLRIRAFNATENVHKIQCFPLYSLMLAIRRTVIHFFSLDMEGAEYKILKTIPWNKVDIKVIAVEWNNSPEDEPAITRLMENNKFVKFGLIEMSYSRKIVYVKDCLL